MPHCIPHERHRGCAVCGNPCWEPPCECGGAHQPSAALSEPPGRGPGTELKKLLARVGIVSSPDCSCNIVANEMDSWGPDECEKPDRIDYIVAAMRDNAVRRGLPFLDAAGRMLVRRAIANARRNA